MNLKTVRTYIIKLSLQEFQEVEDRESAEVYLEWYFWATHCKHASKKTSNYKIFSNNLKNKVCK